MARKNRQRRGGSKDLDTGASANEKRGMLTLRAVLGGIVLVILGVAGWMLWGGPTERVQNMPTVNTLMHGAAAGAPPMPADQIIVPQLTSAGQMGKRVFDEKCATCHGTNGIGTDNGPPFVHKIYEPSHHADFAFMRAVRGGVQAHHWRYGNMSPVEGVTDKQIEWVTQYVRELQRANGIN